jgi:dolichol-phosphate mannosyltransferase
MISERARIVQGATTAATSADKAAAVDLSIVTPIYNEKDSIPDLLKQLTAALEPLKLRYEIIAVDDGSHDGSIMVLKRFVAEIPQLKIVRLRRNAGQTAAIMAGLDHAEGDVIVTIDADLQNDPNDVGKLIEELNKGYDVVSGWRKDRKDALFRRNFISRVANRLISRISRVHLHDYGCTLKAYRTSVIREMRLYGEMHRFIPIYATWLGAKVTEMPVNHRARQFGHSKYGLERIIKVILDLLMIKFFDRYLVKPFYIFGSISLGLAMLSILVFFWMLTLRVYYETSFIETPLPILSAILAGVSIMAFLLGIVAEIMMRTYFESQGRRPYVVGELINFNRAQ